MLSMLFWAFLPVAIALGVLRYQTGRFIWKDPSVYATVVAGCVYLGVFLLTGSSTLAILCWIAALFGYTHYQKKRTGSRFR